jgi:phosphoserine phosphatase RsbU/P
MDGSAHQVLVIDDSPLDRLMLSSILQKEGFHCTTAADGPEGLRRAKESNPDIILLDVLMPGESGFETCAHLKMDPATSPIPVIFLSSESDKQSRVSGLTGGGVDYITKPFETEEVLARLRIHLRIRQAFLSLIEHQKQELSKLKNAQQAILIQPGELPDADFAVHYRPLHAAGGDFYDVIPLGNSIVGYFSADIGGHDLGAAFITSALKALLRQNFTSLYTPLEVMTLLNGVLYSLVEEETVLSACCARLNRRSGRLIAVSAGHPPILHLDSTGCMRPISIDGDLLGAFDAPYFGSVEVKVAPGDRLFFFSDGLIETYHGEKTTRTHGMHSLQDALLERRHLSLTEMVDRAAYSICGPDEAQQDDLLLLGVEV